MTLKYMHVLYGLESNMKVATEYTLTYI